MSATLWLMSDQGAQLRWIVQLGTNPCLGLIQTLPLTSEVVGLILI